MSRWDDRAPATWNKHLAALRSFAAYATGLLAEGFGEASLVEAHIAAHPGYALVKLQASGSTAQKC